MSRLRSVIARHATGTYVVTRVSTGTFDRGRYEPGSPEVFSILAAIQPVAGRDLEDAPDGQRGNEQRVIYTETELLCRAPGVPEASGPDAPGTEPDTITIDGEDWRITKVETFIGFGGTHYRAYAERRAKP